MDCPSQDALAAYAERALPVGERDACEAHAVSCPACCDVLRLLADPGLRRETASRPWLRAAAVLLAASLAFLAWQGRRVTPRAPSPAVSEEPRRTGAGLFAEGIELLPQSDARAVLDQRDGAPVIRLSEGGIWVRGPGLPIETPAGTLRLSGEAWVDVQAPVPALGFLMREARAGDGPRAQAVVLEGRLRWEGGEAAAGARVILQDGKGESGPAPAGMQARLIEGRRQRLEAAASRLVERVRLQDGAPDFVGGKLPPRFRLMVRLAERDPATEVALVAPTPAGPRQWAALLPARGAGASSDLELLFDGMRMRTRLDGRVLAEAAPEALERAEGWGEGRWGVRTWGGAVTIVSASVQELP